MKKNTSITLVIICLVIIFAVIVKTWPKPETPEEIAKCIGENSILYTQTGCLACKMQEEMFSENLKYLNIIDCKLNEQNRQKCIDAEIQVTPTWVINGKKYEGTHSIETLQQLTGCE